MRRLRRVRGAVVAVRAPARCNALALLALAGTAAAQAPDLSPYTSADEAAARLEQGELVELEGVRFDRLFAGAVLEDAESDLVMFVVDTPAQAAWSVFTAFDVQPEFMPHMTSADVVGHGAGAGNVCFEYKVLWVESTNCFAVERDREAGTVAGVLDPANSDERLRGVNYFWHVRPWRGGGILLAYYQQISFSGAFTAFGHEMFVGPRSTAEAVRARIRDVSAEDGAD